MKDPMHKTVCDNCLRGTWYETEQQCKQSVSKSKHCGECGTLTYAENTRCIGTLRVIDRSALAPQFAQYYENEQRIEVLTKYGEKVRGTVGKTMGWKPSYLLLLRRNSSSSSVLLGHGDKVLRASLPWRTSARPTAGRLLK